MKSRLLKRFLISFAGVMFLILTFGATSYAWFDLSVTNTVNQIEINVSSGMGLEMSLDGVNFKENLTARDFQKALGYSRFSLMNVTTDDLETFKGFRGVKDGEVEYEILEPEGNQYFFYVPIWFRCNTIDPYILNTTTPKVYLLNLVQDDYTENTPVSYFDTSADGTWIVSRGVSFVSTVDYVNERGELVRADDNPVVTKYASDSVRLGFITPTGNQKRIFDLSYTALTSGCGTENGAVSYYNATTNTDHITSDMIGGLKANEITTSLTTRFTRDIRDEDDVDSSILTLVKDDDVDSDYWMGQVYVCIWLEGWDADCYGTIFGDLIFCQLSFGLAG